MHVLQLADRGSAGPSGSATASAALAELDRIACGPHRLLGVGGGGAADGARDCLLLGLTDDVDAAVVRVSIGAEDTIAAQHVASVPALAYVAAGKVQRRAVLLGQPGRDCSRDCLSIQRCICRPLVAQRSGFEGNALCSCLALY